MTRALDMIRADPLFLRLEWRTDLLESIQLRWSEPQDGIMLETRWARSFLESMERYLAKEHPNWPEPPLAMEGMSDFTWQVLQALRHVPWGTWLSYGELAARCGKPQAARAVGRVMARNPWPLVFPCHRVLGRSGQLTGFGPGLDMKQYLLAHEGIAHSTSNRVEP